MTKKRWEIIDEEFVSYTGGVAYLISDGDCQFHIWEPKEDAMKVCERLNEQHETIQEFRNIINCLEKGSCKSIDSFLDMYCDDELLEEFGLND